MKPPRIGITLDQDPTGQRYEIKRAYTDAVLAAGGLPFLLPTEGKAIVEAYLESCDGIVISGGTNDIPPERYGEPRRLQCGPSRPERTEFEWALCQAAMAMGIPLLGICGGMQLMNVVCGGTLYQDLPTDLNVKHEQSPPKNVPSHTVEIEPQTRLAKLVGLDPLLVNSTHHQAVRQLGTGLVVSAKAKDGVAEAIERPDSHFVLGVQWHPEAVIRLDGFDARHADRHAAVYRGLVAAACDRKR